MSTYHHFTWPLPATPDLASKTASQLLNIPEPELNMTIQTLNLENSFPKDLLSAAERAQIESPIFAFAGNDGYVFARSWPNSYRAW